MAISRATFFFKQRRWGWSETLFSSESDLKVLLNRAKDYLPVRNNLNGADTTCEYIRVSDDAVKRDAEVFVPPPGDQKARWVTAGSSDVPTTCALIRLQGSPTGRRSLQLRGIPDDIVVGGGILQFTGQWNAAFASWKTEITSGRWAIRIKTNPNPAWVVNGIAFDSAVWETTFTLAGFHTLTTGDQVQILGKTGTPKLNGIWRVKVTAQNTFKIATNFRVDPYVGAALARPVAYTTVPINDAVILRVSKRSSGGPFDKPVGRRRVR